MPKGSRKNRYSYLKLSLKKSLTGNQRRNIMSGLSFFYFYFMKIDWKLIKKTGKVRLPARSSRKVAEKAAFAEAEKNGKTFFQNEKVNIGGKNQPIGVDYFIGTQTEWDALVASFQKGKKEIAPKEETVALEIPHGISKAEFAEILEKNMKNEDFAEAVSSHGEFRVVSLYLEWSRKNLPFGFGKYLEKKL